MKIEVLGLLSVVYLAASCTPVWAGPVGMRRPLSPDPLAETACSHTGSGLVPSAALVIVGRAPASRPGAAEPRRPF